MCIYSRRYHRCERATARGVEYIVNLYSNEIVSPFLFFYSNKTISAIEFRICLCNGWSARAFRSCVRAIALSLTIEMVWNAECNIQLKAEQFTSSPALLRCTHCSTVRRFHVHNDNLIMKMSFCENKRNEKRSECVFDMPNNDK